MADKEEDKKEIVDAQKRKKKGTLAMTAAFVAALGAGGYTMYEGVFVPMQAWDTIRSGDYENAVSYIGNMNGNDYESQEFRERVIAHYTRGDTPVPPNVLRTLVENVDSVNAQFRLAIHSSKVGDSAAVDYILKYSPHADQLTNPENIGVFAFNGNIDILSRLQDQGIITDEIATQMTRRAMLGRQMATVEWLDRNYEIDDASVNRLYPYFFLSAGINDRSGGMGEISLMLDEGRNNDVDKAAREQIITWIEEHGGPIGNEAVAHTLSVNSRAFGVEELERLLNKVELTPAQSAELFLLNIEDQGRTAFFLGKYTYGQDTLTEAFRKLVDSDASERAEIMALLLRHYTPAQAEIDAAIQRAYDRNDNEAVAFLDRLFDVPESFVNQSFLNAVERNRVADAARMLQGITDPEIKAQALISAAEEGYDDMIWAFSQLGMEVPEGTYDKAFMAAFEHREFDTAIAIRNTFPLKQETIAQAVQIMIFDGNIRLARELSAVPQQNMQAPRP